MLEGLTAQFFLVLVIALLVLGYVRVHCYLEVNLVYRIRVAFQESVMGSVIQNKVILICVLRIWTVRLVFVKVDYVLQRNQMELLAQEMLLVRQATVKGLLPKFVLHKNQMVNHARQTHSAHQSTALAVFVLHKKAMDNRVIEMLSVCRGVVGIMFAQRELLMGRVAAQIHNAVLVSVMLLRFIPHKQHADQGVVIRLNVG